MFKDRTYLRVASAQHEVESAGELRGNGQGQSNPENLLPSDDGNA